jgi:catechol 2,3-dioxygenase-like lactoylglutathione lyase family enzyme
MRIEGVLETCLYATDLAAAEQFYTSVLGLEVITHEPGRHVFFRCGRGVFLVFNPERTSTEVTTVGGAAIPLHGARGAGHMAFAVPEADLPAWRLRLGQAGVRGAVARRRPLALSSRPGGQQRRAGYTPHLGAHFRGIILLTMTAFPKISMSAVAPLLLSCFLLACSSRAVAAPATVELGNRTWTVAIDPSSLAVSARVPQKRTVQVSAPQAGLGPVARLEQMPRQAKWELPERKVTVSVRLEDATLEVSFQSQVVGEFTWPVIERQSAIRGLILPTFEGRYVPAHDPAWSAYLSECGEMSTTEGLYLPLWGLDLGDATLTYLLLNPLNNALSFQNVAGHLGCRLTHQFTRHQRVKEYGLRIGLGPASPIEPARQYRRWLQKTGQFVSMREKIRHIPEAAKLLGAPHIYLRGSGVSPRMMEELAAAGFDRSLLVVDGWKELHDNLETISKAKALGYLLAPYDSYNSIHSPDAGSDETWETAQFDRKLYETGAIVRWDGTKKPGFLRKGYLLSPLVTRPYVQERVSRLRKEFQSNAWFIDCDAFGELYEDYSPLHPASQEDDMKARLRRMAWIRDTYKLVIGSEGGSAYAAATIHFAQGMTTPVIGFGDPDLKNPQSPYFLGGWGQPFKQAPLKPVYQRPYFDPRFRLPLYQAVFHDSVVTTDHPGAPLLKFSDQIVTRALLSSLYNVPPLYILDRGEFARQKQRMKAHYDFFSPLHRETGLLPLTEFAWLTTDRLVQKTVFGGKIELVANFGPNSFRYRGARLPGRSILAYWRATRQTRIYTPAGVA